MNRLFERLFDDAAIFPPGNAPMDAAVTSHDEHKRSSYGSFVGPFVCSAARLPELVESLESHGTAVELALVTGPRDHEAAVDLALSRPRLSLRAIEFRLEPGDPVPAGPDGVDIFAEFGWGAEFDLPPGTGLKLRTGGPMFTDVPTEEELAAAIRLAVSHGVPFKLTAGLHRAVRSSDPETGFEQHGFLNVLAATHTALESHGTAIVAEMLAERDPERVAGRIIRLREGDIDTIRHLFRSFGTCSIADPMADLRALSLVDGRIV